MLAVWERGLGRIPLERALALLEAACPEQDHDTLAAMSLGQRDSCLLRLREWVFGPHFVAGSICRGCGQQLELTLHVDHLHPDTDTVPAQVPISVGNYHLLLRPLNSLDLIACLKLDPPEMARAMFSRCLISATSDDASIPASKVPDEIVRNAMEDVIQADPQADLEIIVTCQACHSTMRESFDIISFFWSEIDAWARRILREVHVLALAYGWKEADVLSLSQVRRQFYLEMVSA
jgi:cytochrome c5